MNSLFHSVSCLNYQFQQEGIHLFSDQANISLRNARILAVVTCVIALLGLLVYGIYCWPRQKVVIESTDDEQDVVQEVAKKEFGKTTPIHSPLQEKSKKEEQSVEKKSTPPLSICEEDVKKEKQSSEEKIISPVAIQPEDEQLTPALPTSEGGNKDRVDTSEANSDQIVEVSPPTVAYSSCTRC